MFMFLCHLKSIAMLMQMILAVMLAYICMKWYISLRQLETFRMERCKERMWNLCVFQYGLHLSNLVQNGFECF
jgi:hypothetical protein